MSLLSKVTDKVNYYHYVGGTALITTASRIVPAFCKGEGGSSASTAKDLVGGVCGLVCTIAKYSGMAFIGVAAYQIIMARQNDDQAGMNKGITSAITAIALIALDVIINALLKNQGITVKALF